MLKSDLKAFLPAGAGSAAVGAPWLLWTLPLGVGAAFDGHVGTGILFAALPVFVAGTATFVAMAVIGLPLTAILASSGRESPRACALAGAVLGMVIPLGTLALMGRQQDFFEPFAWLLAVSGAAAGAISGTIWGNYRDEHHQAPDTAPNPIHDLLY